MHCPDRNQSCHGSQAKLTNQPSLHGRWQPPSGKVSQEADATGERLLHLRTEMPRISPLPPRSWTHTDRRNPGEQEKQQRQQSVVTEPCGGSADIRSGSET